MAQPHMENAHMFDRFYTLTAAGHKILDHK